MRILKLSIFILLAFIISACSMPSNNAITGMVNQATEFVNISNAETSFPSSMSTNDLSQTTEEPPLQSTPTPTSTPDIFTGLYNCNMEISFVSGPLEGEITSFSVLGKEYFYDKGDKFNPGKGTAVYYEELHYFILHSSYANGNIFQPMEAEFLRKFLEYWGTTGAEFIQGQIDQLINSEVIWTCNGDFLFTTRIDGVVRLSHESSTRLWLEPRNLDSIVIDQEGEQDQWVGSIKPSSDSGILVGFCGWGPENLGDEKFTYYRYLIQFEVLE